MKLLKSTDDTFRSIGQAVPEALHQHLKELYDVIPDGVPYRLKTLFEVLMYKDNWASDCEKLL